MAKRCKVCGEPVRCRGLCALHYSRDRAERLREHIRQSHREWRKANPEKRRASQRAYRERNIEEIRERERSESHRAKDKAWRERNPEKIAEYRQRWKAKKPPPKRRMRISDEERRRIRNIYATILRRSQQETGEYKSYWQEYYRTHKAERLRQQHEYSKRNAERRREYMRLYRQLFPEKVRETNGRSYERHRLKHIATAARNRMLKRLRKLEAELAKLDEQAGITTKGQR